MQTLRNGMALIIALALGASACAQTAAWLLALVAQHLEVRRAAVSRKRGASGRMKLVRIDHP